MPLNKVFLEASKWVSTKALLPKQYYRRVRAFQNVNAWIAVLMAQEYFDAMHMNSLRKAISPKIFWCNNDNVSRRWWGKRCKSDKLEMIRPDFFDVSQDEIITRNNSLKIKWWNSGKSKWGLSNGGLRPLSAICAQSSIIVHFCGLFGPLFKGNFRHKMTTIVGNRGQLWTSTLSPHLLSPHLDFPEKCNPRAPNGSPLKNSKIAWLTSVKWTIAPRVAWRLSLDCSSAALYLSHIIFRPPFLPPLFPHFSSPLSVHSPTASPPFSSLSPLFWLPENFDLGTPRIYHPGRNHYKIIPWNNSFCNIFVVFFELFLAECRVFLQ